MLTTNDEARLRAIWRIGTTSGVATPADYRAVGLDEHDLQEDADTLAPMGRKMAEDALVALFAKYAAPGRAGTGYGEACDDRR